MKRFPRHTRYWERNSQGTLLCICGRAGQTFAHIGYGEYRGLCSSECREYYMEHKNEIDVIQRFPRLRRHHES